MLLIGRIDSTKSVASRSWQVEHVVRNDIDSVSGTSIEDVEWRESCGVTVYYFDGGAAGVLSLAGEQHSWDLGGGAV